MNQIDKTCIIDKRAQIGEDIIIGPYSIIENNVKNMPKVVIAHTIKGKGVSFMENALWHAKVPTNEEYLDALLELDSESNS